MAIEEHRHKRGDQSFSYHERREDEFGFMRKYWQMLLAAAAIISGYSALCSSVKSHHEIDNQRDDKLIVTVSQNVKDIAVLQESIKALPRMEEKLDKIIMRLPRQPYKNDASMP
jgi:Tfp pilus assembly protein PilO